MFLIFMPFPSVWFSLHYNSLCIPYVQNTKLAHLIVLLRRASPLSIKATVTAAEGKKTSKNLEAASLQNPQTMVPNNQETPRLKHREYSALGLDLLAQWCLNLLLTPNQDRVTSQALTHSSNTLPPSWSSF